MPNDPVANFSRKALVQVAQVIHRLICVNPGRLLAQYSVSNRRDDLSYGSPSRARKPLKRVIAGGMLTFALRRVNKLQMHLGRSFGKPLT